MPLPKAGGALRPSEIPGTLYRTAVAELFAPHNVRLDLPMARADAVKSARALGDEGKQGALGL